MKTIQTKANLRLTPEQKSRLLDWQAKVGGCRACGKALGITETQYRYMSRGQGVRISEVTAERLGEIVGPVELTPTTERARESDLTPKPPKHVQQATQALIADAVERFGGREVGVTSGIPHAVIMNAATGRAVPGGLADALDWFAAQRPDAFGFELRGAA